MVRSTTGRSRQLTGRHAEHLALRFLKRNGLRLVQRNYRCRRGEIDLIMLDNAIVVFVEVRHRSPGSFVRAALTVDYRKQRKLVCAAAMFLAMNKRFDQQTSRFDVVGIDKQADGTVSIDWHKDAFRPIG